jgi:hypothetical protein
MPNQLQSICLNSSLFPSFEMRNDSVKQALPPLLIPTYKILERKVKVGGKFNHLDPLAIYHNNAGKGG